MPDQLASSSTKGRREVSAIIGLSLKYRFVAVVVAVGLLIVLPALRAAADTF